MKKSNILRKSIDIDIEDAKALAIYGLITFELNQKAYIEKVLREKANSKAVQDVVMKNKKN